MNLNQLQYFVKLAQIEHYTKAAKILGISQPTLSHAIATLEQELDTYLFEKNGRNVLLTQYGRVFYKYTDEALKMLETGVRKTKAMTDNRVGRIDIGYIFTQGSHFVPKLVKEFLEKNPEKEIQFRFSSGITEEVLEKLKEEKIDVAFCSIRKKEKDIDFIPVSEENLAVAVPPGHPLIEKGEVTLEEIAEFPQIFFQEGSGLRTLADEMFATIHRKPKVLYTVNEDSALAGLVEQGFGIGIVPEVIGVKSMKVVMLKIKDLHFKRYIYMAVRKNTYLAPIAEAFVTYVRGCYKIER